MSEALLIAGFMVMYHGTGSVPSPMAQAAYNHFETQRYLEAAEKQYLSDEVRLFGGRLFIVSSAIYKQKIEYRFEF